MSKVEIIQQKGYNFLWIDDYLWMWDIPIERRIQKRIAGTAFGHVLVVGYGLGLVQKYLMKNQAVKTVVTVEKENLVDECLRVYGQIYGEIIICDFFEFFTERKFDCVMGDIWQEIDPENLEVYKRFKEKAETVLRNSGRILSWGGEYFEYLMKEKE